MLWFVCFDAVKSCIKNKESSVTKGLKRGPLFFDSFSSDFGSMCAMDESVLYADNTVLAYVGRTY